MKKYSSFYSNAEIMALKKQIEKEPIKESETISNNSIMNHSISGVLRLKLELQSGTSKAGKAWSKQDFIVSVKDGEYTKDVCCQAFNERTNDLAQIKEGSQVTVSFDIDSREYNGRWYTTLRAWKISTPVLAAEPPQLARPVAQADEDLPF